MKWCGVLRIKRSRLFAFLVWQTQELFSSLALTYFTMLNVIEIITDIGAYDLSNNEIVLGLLLIVYCLMIYILFIMLL